MSGEAHGEEKVTFSSAMDIERALNNKSTHRDGKLQEVFPHLCAKVLKNRFSNNVLAPTHFISYF